MCSKWDIITKNFVNLDEYNKLRFKKLVDTNSYCIAVSIDDETKYYLSQAYSELKYYLETIPNKLSISLIEGLSYINQKI